MFMGKIRMKRRLNFELLGGYDDVDDKRKIRMVNYYLEQWAYLNDIFISNIDMSKKKNCFVEIKGNLSDFDALKVYMTEMMGEYLMVV